MDVIPFPPQPTVAACEAAAQEILVDGLPAWAARRLASLPEVSQRSLQRAALRIEERRAGSAWTTDTARLALAALHGFDSWPELAAHVEGLGDAASATARFEAAADAVVAGDAAALGRLLADDPGLIRARSGRRHHSTLLHHVAANGLEDYRQVTPANVVEIARLLLDAGAEVNAPNDDYGGRGTTLGLVATSAHPLRAGVQIALLELLFAAGAALEGLEGGWQPLRAALDNGCPDAAAWLAAHGARLDVVSASALDRLDLIESFPDAPIPELERAFIHACGQGHIAVAEALLARGVAIDAGDGQTGLHMAAHYGRLEMVRWLLERGAPVEKKNQFGGSALEQALWSAAHSGLAVDYRPIIEALTSAAATGRS